MFPGLTEWFQDCSFSRRFSTQILIWGLISKIGTLASLSLLILMFSESFPAAPSLYPDVWSNQICIFIWGTPFWCFILSLPVIAVVSLTLFCFLSLPVSLLFSVCFSLNFHFSKGFTDHSYPFLSVFYPQMAGAETSVITKPGCAKTKWAKLNAH